MQSHRTLPWLSNYFIARWSRQLGDRGIPYSRLLAAAQSAARSFLDKEVPRPLAPLSRHVQNPEALFTKRLGPLLRGHSHRQLAKLIAQEEKRHLIEDALGQSSQGWDMKPWNEMEGAQEELLEAQQLLEELPRLQSICDLLGANDPMDTPDSRPQVIEYLGYSEIDGLEPSGDLARVISRELGYLASPETQQLFWQSYLESRLISLRYLPARVLGSEIESHESSNRGPLIAVIDTSGSMVGGPALLAKASVLALSKSVQTSGRPAWIVSFSDRVDHFPFAPSTTMVAQLARFFAHSFNGGTDLRPALDSCLKLLKRPEFAYSDVLVISDFRVPKVMIKRHPAVEEARRYFGTRFFALSVGQLPMDDHLNIFDVSWLAYLGTGDRVLDIR